MDGLSNAFGVGTGLILVNPKEIIIEYVLRFEFPTTNNESKYEALIVGLKIAKELEADWLQIYSDSRLVVEKVDGNYEAREDSMIQYLEKVKSMTPAIGSFDIK